MQGSHKLPNPEPPSQLPAQGLPSHSNDICQPASIKMFFSLYPPLSLLCFPYYSLLYFSYNQFFTYLKEQYTFIAECLVEHHHT